MTTNVQLTGNKKFLLSVASYKSKGSLVMFCHIHIKHFHLKATKAGVCIESRFMISFAFEMAFAAWQ